MAKKYLSIDLGGTKCAGAIVTEDGDIIVRSKTLISGMSGKEVGEAITGLANNMVVDAGYRLADMAGIGISVPGISYKKDGTVWAPNIPGWDKFPLKDTIRCNLPEIKNISIDNDRACSIMGEYWFGAAQNCENAIYLTFGTGIGAGVLLDGRILRGKSDIAGSVGWLALDDKYPEGYKQFGCFECNASGDGLQRMAKDLYSTEKGNIKTILKPEEMHAANIIAAYQQKDPLALKVIANAIQYWGKGVANMVSIFNPEKIIFGGGLFGPAIQFLDQINEVAKKYAQPIAIDQVKLCAGDLGSDAQLFGAVKILADEL